MMPGMVFGVVLPFPEGHVGRFHQDAGTVGSRAFAMRAGVLHPYRHRMSDLALPGRPAVAANIANDHRTVTDPELGPVVLADPDPFDEAERGR